MKINLLLTTSCLLLVTLFARAEPVEVFAFEKSGVMWGFDFLDDTTAVVTKRSGELYLVDLTTQQATELVAPEAKAKGQGGLLDIKVATEGETTYLYATYSKKLWRGYTTALARAVYQQGEALDWQELLETDAVSSGGRHFGSRLLFVDDYIYMTVGDRGEREESQNLNSHQGKVLRLNRDGTAAANNPFADNEDALPEIWSLGHRNPQGIAIDMDTQQIYVAEFGPRGGDEINAIERGKNYGWPLITYGKNYIGTEIGPSEKAGLEQPLVHWEPSVSPSGMAFVSDEQGKYLLLACLSAMQVKQVLLQEGDVIGQQAAFEAPKMRVRHVATAPNNERYFSTDDGRLFRF